MNPQKITNHEGIAILYRHIKYCGVVDTYFYHGKSDFGGETLRLYNGNQTGNTLSEQTLDNLFEEQKIE